MSWRPLNDFLLVRMDPPKSEVETFLHLPEQNTVVKRSPFATVLRVGPEVKGAYKSGDRILLDRWREYGKTSYLDYEELERFVPEQDISARVEDG